MANIVDIAFNNISIPSLGGGGPATISGTLEINYDTNVVSGTLTATNGSNTETFSNFVINHVTSNDIYSISSTGTSDPLHDAFIAQYIGQKPATVTNVSVGILSAAYLTTQNVSVAAVPVCFAEGTQILTERGEVAIECLRVGDRVLTASGRSAPIRWLGHRSINLRHLVDQAAAQPIRIAKHAFGHGRPSRDLLVSPGHSVCVDVLGEVLIPAGCLVNGATVSQSDLDAVTYWHVELDAHDIVVANGLPCESYIDCGNRSFFSTGDGGVDPLRTDLTLADYCRPFVAAGAIVEAVRQRLTSHAEALGWTKTRDMDIHLVCDGRRLNPSTAGDRARFLLPPGARDVELRSGSFQPIWNGLSDNRQLGISVRAVRVLDGLSVDRHIEPHDELLRDGFYSAESVGCDAWRWTNGCARLPADLWSDCVAEFFIIVTHDSSAGYRWQAPQDGARTKFLETGNVVPLQRAV
jgi:hypothetical protein